MNDYNYSLRRLSLAVSTPTLTLIQSNHRLHYRATVTLGSM